MKKILSLLMLLVSLATANAKCDWSSLKLQQWNNRNVYKWFVSGDVLDDTCVDWMFVVYDMQTKKTDTVWDIRGVCEVQFNEKGKYKMYLKVWNRCEKCDTVLYREVNIIYFPKCNFTYSMRSSNGSNCSDSIVGEMSLGPWTKGDLCWQWWSYIYNSKELNDISQNDWDSISDEELYGYYDFNDTGMIFYQGPTDAARRIKYKFPSDGHYLVVTQWYNECLSQDTFFFTRITVNCNKVTSIKNIVKIEDLKIIGYFDMIGRKVDYMEINKPYLIIYNNGKRQKVMRTE
jgi:hypothetical protein